ncbi:MAG: AAA family ATPase [Clostridia bacterium]|nr:AAA family ATPase [Clostridia bacterium]
MKLEDIQGAFREGRRLLYGSYDSLAHFQIKVEDSLPQDCSIFYWEPHRLKALRYCRNGRAIASLKNEFNKEQEEHKSLTDVLHLIRKSVTSFYAQEVAATGKEIPPNSVVILLEPVQDADDPEFRVLMAEILSCTAYANYGLQIIVYSNDPVTDPFITRHGYEIQIPPPSEEEIQRMLDDAKKSKRIAGMQTFLHDTEMRKKIVNAFRGATPEAIEADITWMTYHHLTTKDVQPLLDRIDETHSRAVQQSEMLSFLGKTTQVDPEHIGGFENFLKYVREASISFTPEARAAGLRPAKGVIIGGPPGTGKSFTAKAMGRIMGMKVIVLDISAAFTSLVGESEKAIRRALRQVERFGSCILMVDEADKAFAGLQGSVGDSGTTRRVLGTFLNWMQEKKSETYVVFTLNDLSVLPPEFIRAGRFDKIFYTSLPVRQERLAIIRKQFAMAGVPDFEMLEKEWDEIIELTDLYSGSELATLVEESQRKAFLKRQVVRPTFQELAETARTRKPQALTDPRIMKMCETWQDFAVPVSKYK